MRKFYSMLVVLICFLFFMTGCSKFEETKKNPEPMEQPKVENIVDNKTPIIQLDSYSLNSETFPKEFTVNLVGNTVATIESTSPNVAFESIKVGDTYADLKAALDGKYEAFYSIHDPDNANIGWYILNDNFDLVIFDFDLEDFSYFNNPPVSDDAKIQGIILTNLKFFD